MQQYTDKNARYEGLAFEKGGSKLYIGFYDYEEVGEERYPNAVIPALVISRDGGTTWETLSTFNTIWSADEDEFGEAKNYSQFLVNHFNNAIKNIDLGELTYQERIALFMRTSVIFDGEKLVIKS